MKHEHETDAEQGMCNFCDICLIYKFLKKLDEYQETIDLCETQIPMTYFVCLNSCEFCHISNDLRLENIKVIQSLLSDKAYFHPDQETKLQS